MAQSCTRATPKVPHHSPRGRTPIYSSGSSSHTRQATTKGEGGRALMVRFSRRRAIAGRHWWTAEGVAGTTNIAVRWAKGGGWTCLVSLLKVELQRGVEAALPLR
jgi:hypothetical protein